MSERTLNLIKDNDIRWVDLRFTDTRGKEQHVSIPASYVDADFFENTPLGFSEKVIPFLEKPFSAEFPYPSVPPYTFGDSSASSAGARQRRPRAEETHRRISLARAAGASPLQPSLARLIKQRRDPRDDSRQATRE